MSNSLDDLSDKMKLKAFELIARAVGARVPTRVVDTIRTPEEQVENIANGVSWTKNSRHLPDGDGKSNAIDLVPLSVVSLKNWAPEHPDWLILGKIGEALGLRWGGRWGQPGGKAKKDCSHFEIPK